MISSNNKMVDGRYSLQGVIVERDTKTKNIVPRSTTFLIWQLRIIYLLWILLFASFCFVINSYIFSTEGNAKPGSDDNFIEKEEFIYPYESYEELDREMIFDMRNDYVPLQYGYVHRRNKRNLEIDSWDMYDENVTNEEIVWEVLKIDSNSEKNKEVNLLVQDNMKIENKLNMENERNNIQEKAYKSQQVVKKPSENVLNQVPQQPQYNSLTDLEKYGTKSQNDNSTNDDLLPSEEHPTHPSKSSAYSLYDSNYIHENKSIRHLQAERMMKFMDINADPCKDFYQYSCGNWEKHNPIPLDKAGYDTFEILREDLDFILKGLLEDQISSSIHNAEDAVMKAKIMYKSCMNIEILEKRLETPLLELLEELGGWPIIQVEWNESNFDWVELMANLRLYNNDILIAEWVGYDLKNSDEYIIQLDQSNLGLPSREYFLKAINKDYVAAYKQFMIQIAIMLGAPLDHVVSEVDDILFFETWLAKIMSTGDDKKNLLEKYEKMPMLELMECIPQIDWMKYFSIILQRSIDPSQNVVVYAQRYFKDLVTLIENTPPRTVANYLLWRFIRHRVNNLDDRFQVVLQNFYYILSGREEAPSRWKKCVAQVNNNLGMAVGAMYISKYFYHNSKNETLQITERVMKSFYKMLNETTWMDDETKLEAKEKLEAMKLVIGYPDYLLNQSLLNERYKSVKIHPEEYFENTLIILVDMAQREHERLGLPANKAIWNTGPAVINAYYSRYKNQIVVPAGILQPPFYHHTFPNSLNYGGIGVVIGHEITHGYDHKGQLFDKRGSLHHWWNENDIQEFHDRAKCLIDQYNKYYVKEIGVYLDGLKSQGENIADNGGINQAFQAYQEWLDENTGADETLPGINATGPQLFFINFAQIWCGSMRREALHNKLKTAVHPPGKFRVIGTLSNSKDFSEAFNCKLGMPMNPTSKCSVW